MTYNHEKYIADAIESFLMQKTDFAYEIIIHDDASTDNTAKIIREYEMKYPEIIKPIYQKENQYSKKVNIEYNFIGPKVRGKYVATCEGDDYWTDPEKLQKQVNFLEKHEDFILCFHAVAIVDTSGKLTGRYLGLKGKGSKELTIRDTVKGGQMHISSRLIRAEYYKSKKPEWLSNAKHSDYASALYYSAEGRVFFIDEVMSHYRTGVENSIMTKYRKYYSDEKEIEYQFNRIQTLNMADLYYNYEFHNDIQSVNLISEIIILILKNDFSVKARVKYKAFIKEYGLLTCLKLLALYKFRFLGQLLITIKQKVTLLTS